MKVRDHAIVLGAGISGILAARALANHFERVTVLERDPSTESAEQRRGTPQARHTHALLASGCTVMERFFPGFFEELVEKGASAADVLADGLWVLNGQRFAQMPSDLMSLLCARSLLESHLRERLRATARVHLRFGVTVRALIGDATRVLGVRLERAGATAEELPASLVVDATGRGSRLPRWLRELGCEAPEEERVEVDMMYVSAVYRRVPRMLHGCLGALIAAAPPNRRTGVAMVLDNERVIVTLNGYLGEHPPCDHAGMRDFARGLPSRELFELLDRAEPLTAPVAYKFPYGRRLRYERLRSAPARVIAVGDAVCSYNPAFGQGMSVAALEAELLDRALVRDQELTPSRFYRELAKIVDAPWTLAYGADLRFAEVQGQRTWKTSLMNGYLAQLVRAASVDAQVACSVIRVLQLVDPPETLLRPGLLMRALWRVWKAGSLRRDRENGRRPCVEHEPIG